MKMVALLLLLLTGGCAEAHPPIRDVAHRLEMEGGGICSGTAVGPALILTASHCLEGGSRIVKIDGRPAYGLKSIHDGADHVLVRVSVHFKEWAKVRRSAPVMGARVRWVGQPAGLEFLYREGYVMRSWSDGILIDASGYFGDSGSGLFCDDGTVCAVLSAGQVWERGPHRFAATIAFPMKFTTADWKAMA